MKFIPSFNTEKEGRYPPTEDQLLENKACQENQHKEFWLRQTAKNIQESSSCNLGFNTKKKKKTTDKENDQGR